MANFPRIKSLGWATNEILTSAQATQLDINVSKSVNGDDGGTYAGALTWTGVHTHQNDIVPANNSHGLTAPRTFNITSASSATSEVKRSLYDRIVAQNGLAANKTIELSKATPTPPEGAEIEYFRTGVTHSFAVIFKSGVAGTTIAQDDSGNTNETWARFRFISGEWYLVAYGIVAGDFSGIVTVPPPP